MDSEAGLRSSGGSADSHLEPDPPKARPGSSSEGGSTNRSGSSAASPTLDDAIREGLSSKEAKRLALRAAEALSALHARDEVHGELTPRSFALGRGGDVRIVPSSRKEPAMYRLRYAAPESARREAPSPQTDVFALSLVVRELIEGLPARRAVGDDLALDAIDGRVSAPHGLEGELQGLAARAASPHADGRPNASEFVAALKGATQFRGFSGQEWVVAGVALVTAVILAVMLRNSAEARDRAGRQSDDAHAALEGFISGSYEDLDRFKDIQALAGAGERALSSMERVQDADRTPEDRLLFGQTLLWNGKARMVQNDDAGAKELFERALQYASSIEDGQQRAMIELRSQVFLGALARTRRDHDGSLELVRGAVAVGEAARSAAPPSRELQLALARAYLDLGNLSMSDKHLTVQDALDAFQGARSLLDSVAGNGGARDPGVLELRVELDLLEANLSFIAQDETRGIELLKQHVSVAKQLVEMDPGVPKRRHAFARGADILARAQRKTGAFPDAAETHRAALEGWRLLREMEPAEIEWRREWARSTRRLAEVLGKVGQWQEASRLHDIALEELEDMLASGDLPPAATFEIGAQLLDAGEGLLAAGDLKRARVRVTRAIELIGNAPPARRMLRAWEPVRIRMKAVRAELLLAEGRWANAESMALGLLDELQVLANQGRDSGMRMERARALLVTSAVRAMEGDTDVARRVRERALGIAEELERDRPNHPEALSLQARTHFALGNDEAAAELIGRLDEAGYFSLELAAVRAATSAIRRPSR